MQITWRMLKSNIFVLKKLTIHIILEFDTWVPDTCHPRGIFSDIDKFWNWTRKTRVNPDIKR